MTVPALVVQGVSDPFGMPPDGPGRTVVQVRGDHGLKADLEAVRAAVCSVASAGGWQRARAGHAKAGGAR